MTKYSIFIGNSNGGQEFSGFERLEQCYAYIALFMERAKDQDIVMPLSIIIKEVK